MRRLHAAGTAWMVREKYALPTVSYEDTCAVPVR